MIIPYLLLTLSILFSTGNSLILRKFQNRTFRGAGDVFFFQGGMSLVWIAVMAVWCLLEGELAISPLTAGFGVIYSIILGLFLYFKTETLAIGPVSLTTLISSCAFLVSTGFGVAYDHETVGLCQCIGIGLILIALTLCINPKMSAEKLSAKWFLCCFIVFAAGGMGGVFYKVFGRSSVGNEVNGMLLVASVSSCVLFFLTGLGASKIRHEPRPAIARGALTTMLLAGITGCIYIRLNVEMSTVIPSAIFFPVFNGTQVMLSTVAGAFVFREKLSKWQIAGIVMVLLSIVLIGCGDVLIKRL